jgi:hypothetical protein
VIVQFVGENDVAGATMEAVQQGTFALWRFCHHAHEAWLSSRASGAFAIVEMPSG